MNRKIALALTTAALIGVAAPTLASPFGDGSTEMRELRAWSIEKTLQQKGVPVTGVEEWGDYVRAYVRTADGAQIMQFYDPITLEQVQP
jgi:hypothetical protein